jgi:hypothetical protein
MLRSLFVKRNNNIFNRILPISVYSYSADNVVGVKRNTIFSNHHVSTNIRNNNVTHSNFKSISTLKIDITSNFNKVNYNCFSTSKIDIESEIVDTKAKIDNNNMLLEI